MLSGSEQLVRIDPVATNSQCALPGGGALGERKVGLPELAALAGTAVVDAEAGRDARYSPRWVPSGRTVA